MIINKIDSAAFKMKFKQNNAYKEVVNYAKKSGRLEDLQRALNALKDEPEGEIKISRGIRRNCNCSIFTLNNISVENTPYDVETFAETSFRAIIDLANLEGRYRALTNIDRLYMRF